MHRGDVFDSCNQCGKSFYDKHTFKSHKNMHVQDRNFECKLCTRSFKVQYALQHHIKYKHTQPIEFKCEACEKCFDQKYQLIRHAKAHSDVRDFLCLQCGNKYKTPDILLNHTKSVHGGERRYKCNICEKAFFNSTKLKEHSLLHTGMKPFQCFKCQKGFVQKVNKNSHEKICSN